MCDPLKLCFNGEVPAHCGFAFSLCTENPLKPGKSRKIKLKINGKRHDALFQRPGLNREYRIAYDAENQVLNALTAYLTEEVKPGEKVLTLKSTGKNELTLEIHKR